MTKQEKNLFEQAKHALELVAACPAYQQIVANYDEIVVPHPYIICGEVIVRVTRSPELLEDIHELPAIANFVIEYDKPVLKS